MQIKQKPTEQAWLTWRKAERAEATSHQAVQVACDTWEKFEQEQLKQAFPKQLRQLRQIAERAWQRVEQAWKAEIEAWERVA